jgi:flagellar hook-basal body complex protein FliE
MTINPAAGVAAYSKALNGFTASQGTAQASSGPGFGDVLKSALQDAVGTEKQGEATTLNAVSGKADINSVVSAVNNAELTLQTVLAVRDKVVAAYTEILHMSV